MTQVSDYTGLITSEHADKPNFMAMVSGIAQCFVDTITALQAMPDAFDLDLAVGPQLDAVGVWIGLNRALSVPIDNVYFSWDTADVGWDQGIWKQPSDPSGAITEMDDGTYRLMLRAKIGSNQWDGSMGESVAILEQIFAGSGVAAKIIDNQDMTMQVVMTGGMLSALAKAMISQGYIPIKPVGVGATYTVS